MKIALVTGGFDPLHSGHIKYFKAAAKQGDKLYVGINSTYNDTEGNGFYGVALYPQYDFGKLSAGVRAEYFAETGAGVGAIGTDADVINLTTTLDYAVDDNLNLKVEYRFDKTSEKVFEQKDNLSSIVVAAIYSFN